MRASAIEFRLRVAIIVVVIALGFWSPWIEPWGLRAGFLSRISLLGWLALDLSRTGLVRFNHALAIMIVCASLLAAAAVILRVWGTAYLGPFVVNNGEMKAGAVMAAGPYRHVRNPLYLGSWCMIAAMSFIMPATGAMFTMTVLTVFLLRLILGEEAFLTAQLGEPYRDYLRAVPRLLPRIRANIPPAGRAPHWGQALLAELNPIGVFFTVAVLSWSYDNLLMVRAILICFGISLVARALVPGMRRESGQPA
jgi:protein-S-isoprenylcysteine O-methyltransferase Ste14